MMPNYNESLRTQIWVCESSNICATWTGGSVLSRESNIRPTVLPTFDIKDNVGKNSKIMLWFFSDRPQSPICAQNLFYDPNVKQMQSMWLSLFSGRQFKETFEEAQWRKVKQMQHMRLCVFVWKSFEATFKTHSGEKSNKCNQCDYGYSYNGHLRQHTKNAQ